MIKALIFTFIFSSTSAFAKTPWADVVAGFTWLRSGEVLSSRILFEAKSGVAFRVYDEYYLAQWDRDEKGYRVFRTAGFGLESIFFPEELMQKILLQTALDQRQRAYSPALGTEAYQCSSELPAKIDPEGNIPTPFKHTWLQVGERTFGMPFTDTNTYFGGRAHVRSPDAFIERGPRGLECKPVANTKRVACVAEQLSIPHVITHKDWNYKKWVAHLDYHVLEHNCFMAARFMLECAGAYPSIQVNGGIGSHFQWTNQYSITKLPADFKTRAASLRNYFAQVRANAPFLNLVSAAKIIINESEALEAVVQGNTLPPEPKTLREICDLMLENCE